MKETEHQQFQSSHDECPIGPADGPRSFGRFFDPTFFVTVRDQGEKHLKTPSVDKQSITGSSLDPDSTMAPAFVPSVSLSTSTFTSTRSNLQRRTDLSVSSRSRVSLRMIAANETHELEGRTITKPAEPLRDYLLVKVAEASDTTTGGLILSSGAKEKPTYGEAVAVGPGSYFPNGQKKPMAVKKGDTVLYGKYGGTDVKYDGKKHTFVTQNDILCTLQGGKYEAGAVKPIFDRVLIKCETSASETTSGILLSGKKEKETVGEVIATGPGRFMENGEYEPMPVKVGAKVMYGKYSGTDIKFNNEDYIIVRASEIYAHWV